MDKQEFLQRYWNYYLTLEEDFEKTNRFVELNKDNYNTYSVEFSKQLQSICSEIDVLCKSICNFYNELPTKKEDQNMYKYTQIIIKNIPDIKESEINLKRINIALKPFECWPHKPEWWDSYNQVKHHRHEQFNQANLKNVLNALGGLFILETYLLDVICKKDNEENDIPPKQSDLFNLKNHETNAISMSDIIAVSCGK